VVPIGVQVDRVRPSGGVSLEHGAPNARVHDDRNLLEVVGDVYAVYDPEYPAEPRGKKMAWQQDRF